MKVKLIAAALLMAAATAQAQTNVRLYADEAYEPYSYKDSNGNAAGIYAEVLKAAAAKLPDYKIDLQTIPWKRALAMIESGEAFGFYPPYRRENLRPWIAPYSVPMLEEKVVVWCNSDRVAGKTLAKYPDDYAGLTFGNNRGFLAPGEAFFQMVKDGKIKVDETDDTAVALKKLAAGRNDCYVNDEIAVRHILAKEKIDSAKLQVTGTVTGETAHVGFSRDGKFDYKDDFIGKLNKVLADMTASGEIKKIVDAQMK